MDAWLPLIQRVRNTDDSVEPLIELIDRLEDPAATVGHLWRELTNELYYCVCQAAPWIQKQVVLRLVRAASANHSYRIIAGQILQTAEWSLNELDDLITATLANPRHLNFEPYAFFYSTSWSTDVFLTQMEPHAADPGFWLVFDRFLDEIFSRSYCWEDFRTARRMLTRLEGDDERVQRLMQAIMERIGWTDVPAGNLRPVLETVGQRGRLALWPIIWETLDRHPGHTLAVLRVLLAGSGLATLPPRAWWAEWESASARLDPAVVRTLCACVWTYGETFPYMSPATSAVLVNGAIYAVASVATDTTCALLGAHLDMWRQTQTMAPITAGIHTLGRIGTPAAIGQLRVLAERIKHKTALKTIESLLAKAAAAQGMDAATFRDRAVDSLGLDSTGRRVWPLGAYRAELAVTPAGRVETHYYNQATGKPVRALPSAVRNAEAPALAELKAVTKRLGAVYSTEKARLETALVTGRRWAIADWQAAFGAHPILRNLAQRLVWRVEEAGVTHYARPTDGGSWVGADDMPTAAGAVTHLQLLHPLMLTGAELQAWQQHIVRGQIVQPFKQIYRETYVLTPAELQTATYSNRFASQVVTHRTLYALLKERGWSGMGYYAVEEPAYRNFVEQSYRVYLTAAAESGSIFGDGFVTLDRVWFARLDRRRNRFPAAIPLQDVPPVVFSEALRDVDLFVGVAGRGVDADWVEWETRRQQQADLWIEQRAQYEQQFAASADQRAAVLRELLPALGLGDRAQLDGRFVLVRGQWHSYRVHLGSGNIHIEPEGRYLCIVPSARQITALYVPFEEKDFKTAEILSKVLLLTADEKITDPSILRQL